MAQEEKRKIVQIRKKSGLDRITVSKQGGTLTPKLFHQEMKDPNADGVILGDYKGRTILDTKYGIAPHWNDLKKQWSWGASTEKLVQLINSMKLRYPKGHNKEGQFIKVLQGENVADRLIHRADDVFNHSDLYGRYFMENGRVSLNLSNPKEEFLFYCYKGDHLVQDKSSDEPVSKFIVAGTKFELVSPKQENKKKKADAGKEIKAITLLAKMDGDEEKLRAVAEIMDLPTYSSATDVTGTFLLLKDMAAQNTTVSAKYNNKTYQDRFIEIASMKDEDLDINLHVLKGKRNGILRRRQDHYLFNGERLDGLKNDIHLVNYFRKPDNHEEYLKLLDLLTDAN